MLLSCAKRRCSVKETLVTTYWMSFCDKYFWYVVRLTQSYAFYLTYYYQLGQITYISRKNNIFPCIVRSSQKYFKKSKIALYRSIKRNILYSYTFLISISLFPLFDVEPVLIIHKRRLESRISNIFVQLNQGS